LEELKYPIGRYLAADVNEQKISEYINSIENLPNAFSQLAKSLTDGQLETPYRPDGWTGREVIHHVAESHMNALIRFKLALTEDNPTIKPYEETLWVKTADGSMDIDNSLQLIEAIHKKWSVVLKSMTDEQWQRTLTHPAANTTKSLAFYAGMYSWHGNHHLAHLKLIKNTQ